MKINCYSHNLIFVVFGRHLTTMGLPLLTQLKAEVIIATTDALAPNQHQSISCAIADLSSQEALTPISNQMLFKYLSLSV